MAFLHARELYRVTMSRVDSNVYKDHDSGAVILTKYCYEYAHRDEAVLRWEGRHGSNRIIFSSGQGCDVKNVVTR